MLYIIAFYGTVVSGVNKIIEAFIFYIFVVSVILYA